MTENDLESFDETPGNDPDSTAELEADEALAVEAQPDVERARLEAAVTAERDKHLRLAAEFDNYRKRVVRERQEAGGRAQAELVQGLVEVLDDIARFAHLDPATVDSKTVVEGVAIVERKVMKTLSGHGLEVVDPTGRLFDPAFHEAVGTEPAETADEDHLVARVYQPGYLFRGQLIRPARVVVKQWLG
jgi:molecular chaperone GrpE